jgi:hypothetical protein
MKLSWCYLESLDCLGLRRVNRLKSWVGGYSGGSPVGTQRCFGIVMSYHNSVSEMLIILLKLL